MTAIQRLEDKMNQSTLEYLKELKKEQLVQFKNQTKDMVLNSEDPLYKYYFNIPDCNIEEEEEEEESKYQPVEFKTQVPDEYKIIIKKIYLIIHPDKHGCSKKAHNAFLKFQILVDNEKWFDIVIIYNEINSQPDVLGYIISYCAEDACNLKKEIDILKRETWYTWHHDLIFRRLYIQSDELEKIIKLATAQRAEIKELQIKLAAQNLELTTQALKMQEEINKTWEKFNLQL
jgi:hypothetical protein